MFTAANLSRLLAVVGMAMPLLLAAQTPADPMPVSERARRDAERVFESIKFHTVRTKPAAEPAPKPSRPAAVVRHAEASSPVAAAPSPSAPAPARVNAPVPLPSQEPVQAAASAVASPSPKPEMAMPVATASPVAVTVGAGAEVEADDPEEVPLQLQDFVAPVLTQEVQATLGVGSRSVKVRFTVEPSGKVSKAEAAPGVPRRLAKPAMEAILQWRFAALPAARIVDVEIAFRRD